MEIGVILPNSGSLATPEAILSIAERAEERGFAALWTADHLVVPVESQTSYPYVRGANVRLDARHPFLDPLITLAGVATRTRRIALGVSVYLAALRHPIVAAKLVASLDQLSGGRVRLGVGAGWIPEEYATLGIEFSERGRVLDEHLTSLRALWEQDEPRFEGEHFQFDNIGFEPKPVQSRLPIWVGGNSGPARRRAARLGDGWHVIDVPLGELAEGIESLHREVLEAGREPSEVVVSTRSQIAITKESVPEEERFAPLVGPLPDLLRDLERMREIGVGHVALWPTGRSHDLASYLERLDELAEQILPAFHTNPPALA